MYRTFYRLLQEIDDKTLIVINECLRTQNRYDLTYNCIRNFLNQTTHQLVFQHLPQIDTAEDFMILFDFATRSQWKREAWSPDLVKNHVRVCVNRLPLTFERIDVSVPPKTKARYAQEKEKLFAGLGTSDPHTLPRNLYLIGGGDKARRANPAQSYVARNQRLKLANISTYENASPATSPYTVLEFPHRFIEFCDFIKKTSQAHFDVLVADLKVDLWYWERYQSWKDRVHATYTSLQ